MREHGKCNQRNKLTGFKTRIFVPNKTFQILHYFATRLFTFSVHLKGCVYLFSRMTKICLR